MKPILEIKNLKVQFKTQKSIVKALNGIDLTIYEGETLGLVGESGCGKSVTSLAVMGLLPERGEITEGSISFSGMELIGKTDAEMEKVRGNKISMIFQEPMTSLNPVFTIGDQLKEAISLHQKASREVIEQRALEMLELVRIPDAQRRMKEYPHQMSGGIRQRIMIAMSLACTPSLLIADEPTTALDVTIQAQILALLRDLQQKLGTSILMITHDLGVVAQVADNVAVMYAGEIVEYGRVVDIFQSPQHPYTAGLLKTIPRVDETRDNLEEIKGMVPDLSENIVGCPFAPRCNEALAKCSLMSPPLVEIGKQKVKCWLYI